MVIVWTENGDNQPSPAEQPKVRAAIYVRMSTEHQKYSTDNQIAAVNRYATKDQFEIVRTYADEGKSGLRLAGRDALQALLRDVEAEIADCGNPCLRCQPLGSVSGS